MPSCWRGSGRPAWEGSSEERPAAISREGKHIGGSWKHGKVEAEVLLWGKPLPARAGAIYLILPALIYRGYGSRGLLLECNILTILTIRRRFCLILEEVCLLYGEVLPAISTYSNLLWGRRGGVWVSGTSCRRFSPLYATHTAPLPLLPGGGATTWGGVLTWGGQHGAWRNLSLLGI